LILRAAIAATITSMLLRQADCVLDEAVALTAALRVEDMSVILADEFLGS
jgi:hypothetical protein